MAKKIRVLSLDGGGIRGIITAVVLIYIQEQLQRIDNPNAKIGDYFDLVAGSSTGGLLTAILLFPDNTKSAKFSVEAALDLYAKKEILYLMSLFGKKSSIRLDCLMKRFLKEI